ncbi:MAG TPA: DNA polymerase I [Candidatus Binataceae bacterium]|nr:DNA polymerase I [Candidatus Binataceae bacterium]
MSEARPILYLVDGSGYIFRAFHALPPLNNSRGLPTNAIYGFLRMLLKLLKDTRPRYLAIVFDAPARTFRDDLFENYKANRAAPASDLQVQFPYIYRLVDAFGITRIIREGYEADDVIGTLALRALRQHFEVVILTGDKDFMQLVRPHLSLWDTMRERRVGPREVVERTGVEPSSVVDLMALTGDPIDNVRGLPGVGDKTAAALLNQFGSLDQILANPAAVAQSAIRGSKKLAQLIADHRGELELSRKLVRIDTAVPIDLHPESFTYAGIDEPATIALLRELEFTSVLAELGLEQGRAPAAPVHQLTLGPGEIQVAATRLAGARGLALHLQSEQIQVKALDEDAVLVVEQANWGDLRELLGASGPPRACHDYKAHLRALHERGLGLGGVAFDTMLAGFLINPGRAEPSLEDLYHEHLAAPGAIMAKSATEIVAALWPVLEARLRADGLGDVFAQVELPLAAVLAEMEEVGVGIDVQALTALGMEFSEQLHRLESECSRLAGHPFNLNSPNQLREVLFNDLKLPTKGLKKTKSGYSTDVDVLTKLAALHELPRKLLEYRTIAKLKSTYVDALPAAVDRGGRLHSSFHQALTATGRLSSTDPNLQNIPTRSAEGRRIRRAFVARPGALLLSADYSQIELRILAHLSADPTLVEAFVRGEDIHQRTAVELLGVSPDAVDSEARRLAKVINFGIIYGMGPQRLAGELAIALEQAASYIKAYFARLPGVSAWFENCLAQARARGYVATLLGRRRYLPELNSPQGGARAQAERIAINTPIQGTAADLIKMAMVRLQGKLAAQAPGAQMVLQVHDELLFEVPQAQLNTAAALARAEMEQVAELAVPLRVELKAGPNWADLSPLSP